MATDRMNLTNRNTEANYPSPTSLDGLRLYHLEQGPEPNHLVAVTRAMVHEINNPRVRSHWDKREEKGLALAEATDAVEQFRKGVDTSIRLATELLQGKEFEYWDFRTYAQRMTSTREVVSGGQFAHVGGMYGFESGSGSGPVTYVSHPDLFPDGEGILIDALTKATVTGLGSGFPDHVDAVDAMNRLVGGTQCNAYHYTPLVGRASEALLSIIPVEREGAKVAWFNAGGGAVSVGIKAAENYVTEHRGQKPRKPVYFKDAYHGNNEGRAGAITSGVNESVHPEERAVELPFPSNPTTGVEVITKLQELLARDEISCVVLEPTQGDGGGDTMDAQTFVALAKLSIRHKLPLIIDEVQSGFGRSGRYFDVEYLLDAWKADPEVQHGSYPQDIPMMIAVAKSLTNGAVPGSAIVFSKEYDVLGRAEALNTYSGHPTTLAATIATVRHMTPDLLEMVHHKRAIFDEALAPFLQSEDNQDSILRQIKGHGNHIFVEIDSQEHLQLLQIMLLGRKRILAGTVAKNGLRIHLPNNAPDIVFQAVAQAVGDIATRIAAGQVDAEAVEILRSGPSGLAERTVRRGRNVN